ncbi:peptidase A1 family protein [Abortiporus biennis]
MGVMHITEIPSSRPTSTNLDNYHKRDGQDVGFTMKAYGNGVMTTSNIGVQNTGDVEYHVEILVAGEKFTVVLDTGSSDLLVVPEVAGVKLKNSNTTSARATISFAAGSASGDLALANVQLGSYTVPQQLFLNVDQIRNFPDGIEGVLGMSLSRGVLSQSFNVSFGSDLATKSAGNFIENVFTQKSNDQDFFDILLGRSNDLDDVNEGRFMIGEHAPGFENIQSQPKLFRQSSQYWDVSMQSVTVNGIMKAAPKSNVNGTPAGNIVTVLDTGFSLPPLPPVMVDAIYSNFPGSVFFDDGAAGQWIIPCMSSANVTFTVGGQSFPIHPLDLTRIMSLPLPDLGNVTLCVNTFVRTVLDPTAFPIDGVLGDPFLRNAYVSYNSGDENQGPYAQLLSTTDPVQGYAEFTPARATALKSLPLEVEPSKIIKAMTVLANANTNTTSTSMSLNSTTAAVIGAVAEGDLAGDNISGLSSTVNRYGPVVIGLLAANLLVGLLLLIIGISAFLRGVISKGGKSRSVASTYAPVRFKDPENEDSTESKVFTNYSY